MAENEVPQTRGVRGLFVGSDHSMAEKLRRRRWADFTAEFPDFENMNVLDLGGTTIFWERAPVRPKSVTVINLAAPGQGNAWVRPIMGDACEAQALVAGEQFDLVFSNSLIEHLGGHRPRLQFAEAVRALAPRYAVQTPYRYFPIEPHWVFPGMQFLPLKARYVIANRWPMGHTHGRPPEEARDEVLFCQLLSLTDMREYFPDAHFRWERVAGVPKSLTAYR